MLVLNLTNGKSVSIKEFTLHVEVRKIDKPCKDTKSKYIYVVFAKATQSGIDLCLYTFSTVDQAFSYIDLLMDTCAAEMFADIGEDLPGGDSCAG